MAPFNQRALEIVLLIADHGSVTAAAKVLGVTQSFVSKQLVRQEDEWGDRLFDRTGRGMVLSSFGREVIPEIKSLLAQARRLDECVRDNSGVPAGILRVWARSKKQQT
ncbi:LysR family transcriptional regulator [Pusillimonas sp. ANT_WB101]|uniref:LysR family transcriptional regulator n=1 Tax=Pusillimonas sp. ANT_WB101 TaxID=2597356 RepID=UPI0011EFAB14|nr:LysR family transcriptional regulator [Pusillimonas sp. ANT_WB101]KAA0911304.1 LysR family transcriptional regulator [Pusillimonas sp. ANT_WB101]